MLPLFISETNKETQMEELIFSNSAVKYNPVRICTSNQCQGFSPFWYDAEKPWKIYNKKSNTKRRQAFRECNKKFRHQSKNQLNKAVKLGDFDLVDKIKIEGGYIA